MPQVHVENMAAAHLIAAQRLHAERERVKGVSEPVAGEMFNIADFSQNIVSLCEHILRPVPIQSNNYCAAQLLFDFSLL